MVFHFSFQFCLLYLRTFYICFYFIKLIVYSFKFVYYSLFSSPNVFLSLLYMFTKTFKKVKKVAKKIFKISPCTTSAKRVILETLFLFFFCIKNAQKYYQNNEEILQKILVKICSQMMQNYSEKKDKKLQYGNDIEIFLK